MPGIFSTVSPGFWAGYFLLEVEAASLLNLCCWISIIFSALFGTSRSFSCCWVLLLCMQQKIELLKDYFTENRCCYCFFGSRRYYFYLIFGYFSLIFGCCLAELDILLKSVDFLHSSLCDIHLKVPFEIPARFRRCYVCCSSFPILVRLTVRCRLLVWVSVRASVCSEFLLWLQRCCLIAEFSCSSLLGFNIFLSRSHLVLRIGLGCNRYSFSYLNYCCIRMIYFLWVFHI